MKFRVSGEIISVSKKISKATGEPFNIVEIGFPGYEKFELMLPEQYVPDAVEGKAVEVDLIVGFAGWKPFIKIGYLKAVDL